jgi:hypothetical protein
MKGLLLSVWVASLLLAATAVYGQTLVSDYESGYQDWVCDFADYDDSLRMELKHDWAAMPGITPAQNGVTMSGQNFTDDLFFFMKKKITGLQPNMLYTIEFAVDIVTNIPYDACSGSDLMLKAGAMLAEPEKTLISGIYKMNIKKSNQWQPGPDMDTLGRTIHSAAGSFAYHLITLTNGAHPFCLSTDAAGTIWLAIGAESGFEAYAEFNVAKISVRLQAPTSVVKGKIGERKVTSRTTATTGFTLDGKAVGASAMTRTHGILLVRKNGTSRLLRRFSGDHK